MVKPAPTRTKSKVPVSLSPVRAPSTTPAVPHADTPPPPKVEAPKVEVQMGEAVASAKPPQGQPASPAPVAAKPATLAAAVPAELKSEPVTRSGSVDAKPLAAPAPVASVPAKAVSVAPPLPVAKPMPATPAPNKVRVEKPVAKVVAPKAPARAAAKTKGPKVAVARSQAPKPALAKPALVKPALVKPVASPPAALKAAASRNDTAIAAASKPQAMSAPAAAPAKPVAPPVSLDALPLPRPPEAATVATATVMSQALTMARAFGALQARMLDHACAELEATLHDAETLARSNSASEAIALQAKAVRRSYDSYAEHLKELARVANAALRKD